MISGYAIPDGKEVRIAISGRSGCGNTTVSRILAETLDISLVNYTFRSLAQELGLALPEIIERAKTDASFDRMVDTRQVELARRASCVLGSRLAIWMLTDADLRVYLTAGEETRSRRIMNREGGSLDDIMAFTAMRDAEDKRRYKELYDIDTDEYSFADLVIDVERIGPDEIARIILEKLVEKGIVVRG